MKKQDVIKKIVKDLKDIDKDFQADESAVKELVQKMLDNRPDATIDPEFKRELKRELKAQFRSKKREKRAPFWSFLFKPVYITSFAAIVIVLAGVGLLRHNNSLLTYNKSAIVSDSESSEESIVLNQKEDNEISSDANTLEQAPEFKADFKSELKSKEISVEAPFSESADIVADSIEKKPSFSKTELEEDDADKGYVAMDRSEVDDFVGGAAPALAERSKSKKSLRRSDESTLRPEAIEHSTEAYSYIEENDFRNPLTAALSTFSIDVDSASYSNARRYINRGSLPPKDAVRIEELINYFDYDYSYGYKGGFGKYPFSVNFEYGPCPWNSANKLLHIGIKGNEMAAKDRPASNIVFLIDVSGSMNNPNKLGLLKKAYALMLSKMDKRDKVSIVAYAGAAGVVLPSTSGSRKKTILSAIDRLEAGGSTAGGQGIQLAYNIARANYIKGGNNRVVLATDGDFNVGQSSDAELVRMVEKERKSGVFLTVLGFGMGNYKDSKMEQIADKGDGNYAYIDTLQEAKKVLVTEMSSTLYTIAKDVKIQVEFNPAFVKAYRLIGYENRKMKAEDFKDDKKDAGEIGAGHTVTAIYEIVPVRYAGSESEIKLKYQKRGISDEAYSSNELATVKLRFKYPTASKSILIERQVASDFNYQTNNFYFSAAVAQYGMLLRNSKYKGSASYKRVVELAEKSKGKDSYGYRREFIQIVKKADALSKP